MEAQIKQTILNVPRRYQNLEEKVTAASPSNRITRYR
jgi:hypothetical protein